MSARLVNNLSFYTQFYKFITDLNRKRFSATPGLGIKTLNELDELLSKNNFDLSNYYSGNKKKKWYYDKHRKIYL